MTNRTAVQVALASLIGLACVPAAAPEAAPEGKPGPAHAGGATGAGGAGTGGKDAGSGGAGGAAAPTAGSGGTRSPGGAGGSEPSLPDADGPADLGAPSGDADPPPGPITDPGQEGDGDTTINPPYNMPPEATLQAGITPGKLQSVPVTSKVFPGGDRMLTVYIPNGYVAGTPAPFMVIQDGPSYINNFKLNTVLDNMIGKKQLPAMICIFVPNGGPAKRSFEYDSLTDLYTRFVLEEVLPTVEKSLPVKLTTDPEGRAAGGHSSGGIAAFTMGWLRPDQFHRILTNSGSFVNIRGGSKYPDMVKMAPAKPLRVFLSAGTKDQQSPQWQKANAAMATALSAQKYHYRFVMLIDGTHMQNYPASILPESLLWLWRGYPIAGK